MKRISLKFKGKEKKLTEFEVPEFKQQKGEKARWRLCCGAIIYHMDKGQPYYLLVKYRTYWGFVKGMVELGETEEQTINRETAEEAGLYDLQIFPHFRQVQKYFCRFNGELIKNEVVYLLAKTESWTVRISHEHENYRWCTFEEAVQLLKRVKPNVILLKKADDFIKKYYMMQSKMISDFINKER
jgi:8-oxo-dGTP pyrophosphatase MutT (NUDIX family)